MGERDDDREPPSCAFRLEDGTPVRVRALRPEDAEAFLESFSRLSASRSRGRRRFFGTSVGLGPRELRHLTRPDGDRHVALVAVELDAEGQERAGLGVARFVRLPNQPEVAEPAIAVVDEAQGRGLGRRLSLELVREAGLRGVRTFRCVVLDENEWIRERIRHAYPRARLTRRSQLLGVEFPLPGPAEPIPENRERWAMLRWVAGGAVRLRVLRLLRSWRPLRVARRRAGRGRTAWLGGSPASHASRGRRWRPRRS